jgi:hypothetical protein
VHRTEFDDDNAPRRGNKKYQSLQIIFVLKKEVTQKPDPGALPSDQAWKEALDAQASEYWMLHGAG